MTLARTARLALLLLLAFAAPAMAQAKKKGSEPTFDNRTLTEWIADLNGLAPYTRVAAAYAIASMGPDGAPAVPTLTANLKSDQPTVRYSSALALGEIGPNAAAAVPELRALLDDRNDDIAHMAKKSLKKITGEVSE